MEPEVSCLNCDWSGGESEAEWHDMSHFDDDSMCSNQENSGCFKCPECGHPCVPVQ